MQKSPEKLKREFDWFDDLPKEWRCLVNEYGSLPTHRLWRIGLPPEQAREHLAYWRFPTPATSSARAREE